jgi:hypothetical protein
MKMTFEEAMNERELNVIERELNVIGKTLAEVERLKKSVTELSNLLTASLSGGLYLEQENEQLREALKMCDPDYTDEIGYIRCQFCNGINHEQDCKYMYLIGGVANE